MDAHTVCADCGRTVALYFDGEDVRVMKHDVCGMGGQKLEVNERARRIADVEVEQAEGEARS